MNCYKTKLGTIENRKMDEHIVLSSGNIIEMKNDSLHFDFKSLNILCVSIIGILPERLLIILSIQSKANRKNK